MSKPEWMPENPCSRTYRAGFPGMGMIDNPRHEAWGEGSKATAKAILEYQIASAKFVGFNKIMDSEYGITVENLQQMLSDLEKRK